MPESLLEAMLIIAIVLALFAWFMWPRKPLHPRCKTCGHYVAEHNRDGACMHNDGYYETTCSCGWGAGIGKDGEG